MGLQINNNIAAFNSYRNLSVTSGQMEKSLEKLSSGFRINRAADDAAGLAISEGLRSQVGGLKQAVRNAQDGISVVQTAEGALTESHAILQRMRDLSVQASNDGGLNTDAKKNIQSEINQLKSELTRIADTTKFNGKALLDGSYSGTFQVGANSGEVISVSVGSVGNGMGSAGLGIAGVDVSAVASNATALDTANSTAAAQGAAAVTILDAATDYGDDANVSAFDDLNGTITIGGKSLDLATVKYAAADDTAAERITAIQNAANAAFGTGVVTVADEGGAGLSFTGTAPSATATNAQLVAADVTFTAASGASEAIDLIDDAIKSVSTTRAELGAVQNRFDHTIKNLNVAIENLSASESRIRDTDMALEMVNFTKNQILSQAGTAMLAQANQAPQGVLQLLR